MNSQPDFEVTILGGGLAGLTLARQLLMARPETRIAIVEKQRFPVSETTHKVGESTVEIGAHYFGEELGLKKHLTEHQLPKFGLRFFFKEPDQSLAEGTEVGGSHFFDAPSYQVDRGRLENHLAESVQEMGATLLSGSRFRSFELASESDDPNGNHRVVFNRGGEDESLTTRWLVDASGRASFMKRRLDLSEDLGHDINAVWFRVDENIQVDRWCDDPEWSGLTGKVPRRWLSTNHLMGDGYWVWLIPLATGSTSVGIVADPQRHKLNEFNSIEKAINWLEEHEPECARSVAPHRDRVQDFLAIKKMSRGARQVYSADRWALTGEAAAFLDPFYSPGSDFIAIGNTMIGKLIEEDLAGRPIDRLAPALQSVFLTLFHNNLLTYKDQYPLFGNPQIMALKFVWDYAVYWGFPALLYFNGKLSDIGFIQSISGGVAEIRQLNQEMQDFFREWYESDPSPRPEAGFVDQSEIDLMTRMNAELREKLDSASLRMRFEENVQVLRDLKAEICERVTATHEVNGFDSDSEFDGPTRLDTVFEVLNL